MPTQSPSTENKLTSTTLANWLEQQPEFLPVYIVDAGGEVIAVSDVRVTSGADEEPNGVFFETLRTFVPHGKHVLSDTSEAVQLRNDQIRQEALARSIESFKGMEFVDNATFVERAEEFYTFLGGK